MRRRRGRFNRVDRVGALMRDEVERVITFELSSPLARHVQVTDTKLAADMGHLRIRYVMRPAELVEEVPATPTEQSVERAQQMLDHASGYVARVLTNVLQLRKTPKVVFSFDKDYEQLRRVQQVLAAESRTARNEEDADGAA
ncbi:MAG TPA: hypothetical protein DCQ06_13215 [Myxococcales bacterium]|nr:hypothetical protein [Myxococcales bacterium]HAN32549.1 hypothetical protein [Myxococcales bacterium]